MTFYIAKSFLSECALLVTAGCKTLILSIRLYCVYTDHLRQRIKKRNKKLQKQVNLCRFAQVQALKQLFEYERRNYSLSNREWAN